jgi:hypothetical protein
MDIITNLNRELKEKNNKIVLLENNIYELENQVKSSKDSEDKKRNPVFKSLRMDDFGKKSINTPKSINSSF